jgi:hypothetical protein
VVGVVEGAADEVDACVVAVVCSRAVAWSAAVASWRSESRVLAAEAAADRPP